MPKLHVVVVSTREGRQGIAVARWFFPKAVAHGGFDCELVDLKEMGLPLFDEPNHPMKRQYTKEHTKRWSASVAAADAFVFVTPEYNYSMPPSLSNALDFLYHEWHYKPAAFVSYGGLSGGLRSAHNARAMMTVLKMVPLADQVALPFFMKSMAPDGTFDPGDVADKSIKGMLDELRKVGDALAVLRS